MNKNLPVIAALLGALSVALGAFAAHGLRNILSIDTLAVFETAVRYQFWHVLALLFVWVCFQNNTNRYARLSALFFLAGIFVFCGSLYLLTYIKYRQLDHLRWIGAITPVGGLSFIIGWLLLVPAFRQTRSNSNS